MKFSRKRKSSCSANIQMDECADFKREDKYKYILCRITNLDLLDVN